MQQTTAIPDQDASDCTQNAGENGVHITGGCGTKSAENRSVSGDFGRDDTVAPLVNRTEKGYSSAVERPVHIGKAGGSTPSSPTAHRRFKSAEDQGFSVYFWSRVAVGEPDQCWLWKLSCNRDGYGQIKVGKKYWIASRLAYTLATGKKPAGVLVCHHCDCPSCCNPSHLYAGSSADNVRDMKERGRAPVQSGSHNGAARLTARDVYKILRRIKAGQNNCQIAKQFGVHHSTISVIRTGRSWKHLTARLYPCSSVQPTFAEEPRP